MKTTVFWLAALVVAAGLTYTSRIEVAGWAVERQLDANRRDIAFVASLAPVLCVYDKVNDLAFDSLADFRRSVRYLSDEMVPELERATSGAVPFDGPSRRLQTTILQQVATVKESVATVKQRMAGIGDETNLFSMAFSGLSLAGYVGEVAAQIDEGNERVLARWDEYLEALGQRMESDLDPFAAVAGWAVSRVFAEPDAMTVVNATIDRLVARASADSRFRQTFRSGCLNHHILSLNRGLAAALVAHEDSYKFQVVCLVNNTAGEVTYQYRWGGAAWQDTVLDPGASRWHSAEGDDSFSVEFDASFEDGYQRRNYWLRTKTSGEEACGTGRRYNFAATAAALELREIADVR